MNEHQQSTRQTPKRYRRRSTKRRHIFRPPAHPGRLLAILLAVIGVVIAALIWGNILKRQSDAYRAAAEEDAWTLSPDAQADLPTATVPAIRAYEIAPEGNVGDIVIGGAHGGVILPLRDSDGTLYYRAEAASRAGITGNTVSLTEDVARIVRRDLRVIGVFHVTCFGEESASMQTYVRGLELSLLCEYAASGIDDILLVGLPCGDNASDALSVTFLEELKSLCSPLPKAPAIGVALSLSSLEGKTDEGGKPLYAGDISPARLARASDYLALDLRYRSTEEIDDLLPNLAYAYGRHGLRMMVDKKSPTAKDELLGHGFTRVFEMKSN